MNLSLSQAAKETGKSKTTISRYIKSGKMSVVSKDDSGYQIDPSELFRVFPAASHSNPTELQSVTIDNTPLLQQEIDFLRQQLQEQQTVITKLEADKDDYKKRLDKSQSIVEKQTMLLSDQRENLPDNSPDARKGFFATLLGKK